MYFCIPLARTPCIYVTDIKIRNYEVRPYGDIHYIKNLLCENVLKERYHSLDCELHFSYIFFLYYQYIFISQDVYKIHR